MLAVRFGELFVEVAGVVLALQASGARPWGELWPHAVVLLSTGVVAAYGAALAVAAARGVAAPRLLVPALLVIASLLAVAVHRGGGAARVIDGSQGAPLTLLASMVALLAAVAVHVVVHEAGHVAGARLVGSRFRAVRFGPVLLHREEGRLRLRVNRLGPAGLGGFTLFEPRGEARLARDFAVAVAGGPAASVALTLALWLGARAVSPPADDGAVVLSFVLWHGVFVGAFASAMNLVPRRLRSGIRNDGALLLLARSARTPAGRAFLRFFLHSAAGRRPREWGATVDDFEAAASDPRAPPEVRLAALCVALDTGDWARAEAILARGSGQDRREDQIRQEFALQAAALAALVRGDPAAARARLAEVGPPALPGYPMLAEAALAATEGRADEARALLARWRDLADRTGLASFRVGNEWAEERLDDLLAAPRAGVA